jgi:hypothetical protein
MCCDIQIVCDLRFVHDVTLKKSILSSRSFYWHNFIRYDETIYDKLDQDRNQFTGDVFKRISSEECGDLRKDNKNKNRTISRKSLGNQQVEPCRLFKIILADCRDFLLKLHH